MLYGLLGLQRVINSMAINISINYKNSVRQVYTDLVYAFVRDKCRLSVFVGAGIGHEAGHPSLDFPSWVPDLRNFRMIRVDNAQFTDMAFGPAGSRDAVATFSANLHVLCAEGTICSVVQDVRPRNKDNFVEFTASWAEMISLQEQPLHPTGIPHLQALFRTIICDFDCASIQIEMSSPRGADRYNEAVTFLAILGLLATKAKEYKKFRNSQKAVEEIAQERFAGLSASEEFVRCFAFGTAKTPEALPEDDIFERYRDPEGSNFRLQWLPCKVSYPGLTHLTALYEELVTSFLERRTLFTLEDGYFGIGPPGTMKGDRLYILLGCELPLLIRPQDQHHVLVGSCYVYGAMRGEFMDDVDTGKRRVETVVLH